MAAPRTRSQRERDKKRIAELYLQGWTQEEIATELGISRRTVTTDIKSLYGQWQEDSRQNTDQRINQLEQKHLYLYKQSLIGWLRSLENKEVQVQESSDNGEGQGSKRAKVQLRTEGQSGNAAFINAATAQLEAIAKLRGLNAPTHIITWQGELIELLKQGSITVEDVLDELGDGIETRQLLESAGVLTIESRAVEVASEKPTESTNSD